MDPRDIAHFITEDPDISQLPDVLYHGTSSVFANSIAKSGLNRENLGTGVGGERIHNAIYLTSNREAANGYGEWVCDRYGGTPIVVAVRMADLDPSLFIIDESFWDNLPYYYGTWDVDRGKITWQEALMKSGTIAYADDIARASIS
jgi:hypothetical protein